MLFFPCELGPLTIPTVKKESELRTAGAMRYMKILYKGLETLGHMQTCVS